VTLHHEPETVFTVDPLCTGQPPLTVSVATLGGGTVGQACADNDWIYAVHLDGTLVASGIDLHCGGFAQTHRQMAAALAAALADSDATPSVLAAQAERLSGWGQDYLWKSDVECPGRCWRWSALTAAVPGCSPTSRTGQVPPDRQSPQLAGAGEEFGRNDEFRRMGPQQRRLDTWFRNW